MNNNGDLPLDMNIQYRGYPNESVEIIGVLTPKTASSVGLEEPKEKPIVDTSALTIKRSGGKDGSSLTGRSVAVFNGGGREVARYNFRSRLFHPESVKLEVGGWGLAVSNLDAAKKNARIWNALWLLS